VEWRPGQQGVRWGELRLSGDGEAWRIRVILARFDPAAMRLDMAWTPDRLNRPGKWTVDEASPEAALAFNAGQFTGAGPWGWMVQDGVELRAPGRGPLAPAIVADGDGALRFVPPDSLESVRAKGECPARLPIVSDAARGRRHRAGTLREAAGA
jgi:hypothetical protein